MKEGIRGNAQDVGEILDVPVGWVYAHSDVVPGLTRVGKYLRWDLSEVVNWKSNMTKSGERGGKTWHE